MTIELSDEQLDHLIGIMAEHRVAVMNAISDLRLDLSNKIDDLKTGLGLVHTGLGVLEEDLGKIQSVQREHTQTLDQHTQYLEGLTELSKTNFDLLESLNKHIHGESSTIDHDAAIRGTHTQ